jgi:uncharacterized protein YdeI (YjbR/CyaY-like superfamily)
MSDRDVLDVRSIQQWEDWLAANHESSTEVWLRLFNKTPKGRSEATGGNTGVDVPLTYGDAVEAALCFGWIDSLARGHDDVSRIQRFSPRKARSGWSKSNVERVQRLLADGRMRPAGQREIDAAVADGRWPT